MSIHAANIQPLAFKALSHNQTVLNNLVCGTPLQIDSQIHGAPCKVSLHPLQDMPPLDIELQLSVDGLPVRIQVSKALFSNISMGNTPLSELIQQLPDELRLGCANVALERLLADLRAALQRDIRLQRIGRCEHVVEGTPALSVQFHNGEFAIAGVLIVSDQIHNQLLGAASTANNTTADHIAMPLSLEIGHTVIADTRLQQLAAGDIVLMDRCWYQNNKHIFLRLSATDGYLGVMEESCITLKQRIKQGLESGMSDDFDDFDDLDDDFDLGDDFDDDLDMEDSVSTVPEPAAAPVEASVAPAPTPAPEAAQAATPAPMPQQVDHRDVQGLPVKLTFDVGQQELTVGDMGHLSPGYAFELNRDLTSPVTMKANGKPFAECELVSINNKLGARIVRLL